MGAQDLHKQHGDLFEIKSKCINNSSRNTLESEKHHSNSPIITRRNTTRNNGLKMIKRKRARLAGQDGSKRRTVIGKKVRTLKKLIPNAGSTVGLDGLFRETAEYISSLEMRVRIMQAAVNALSNSE